MAYTWTDQGGYLASASLSRKWAAQFPSLMKFRLFARAIADEHGKRKGETFNWDIYGDLVDNGRALSETERMPETNLPITQGSLTVTEYGISVPFPFKMEALSMLDVKSPILNKLKYNAAKVLDGLVETAMNSCNYRYVANGGATTTGTWTTNGVAAATATANLNAFHLKNMVDKLRTLNAPTIKDHYMCIGSILSTRGLYDSLEDVWKYTQYPINGEVGRYYRTRVMEETAAITNVSTTVGRAYVFGGDETYDAPVIEAVCVPEEIRYKRGEDDYGRSKGIAWYYLGGFSLVHDNNPNNNVVKFDSA